MDLNNLCNTLLRLGFDRVSFAEDAQRRMMTCALFRKGEDAPAITETSSYPVFLAALRLATQEAIRQANYTMGKAHAIKNPILSQGDTAQ